MTRPHLGGAVVLALLVAPALTQGAPPDKDVRVVNSPAEAVPVQLQAGASVGISGTPTVNVVKSPARKPWQTSVVLDLAEGETSRFVSLPDPTPGKRIVIEFGSAQLLVLRTQVPYIQLYLSMTGNDAHMAHFFALTNVGAYSEGQYVWEACHPLRLTSAQGQVRVLRAGGSNGPFFASLSLSGYEEDNE